MRREQLFPVHPAEVGFSWAYLKRQDVSQKGRQRLLTRLGLGSASVAAGVILGVILFPSVQSGINDIIAKDNNVFRQTSQMYR